MPDEDPLRGFFHTLHVLTAAKAWHPNTPHCSAAAGAPALNELYSVPNTGPAETNFQRGSITGGCGGSYPSSGDGLIFDPQEVLGMT